MFTSGFQFSFVSKSFVFARVWLMLYSSQLIVIFKKFPFNALCASCSYVSHFLFSCLFASFLLGCALPSFCHICCFCESNATSVFLCACKMKVGKNSWIVESRVDLHIKSPNAISTCVYVCRPFHSLFVSENVVLMADASFCCRKVRQPTARTHTRLFVHR